MTAAEAFAPAKINLTLHVTGQLSDGYHLLDSLVAFADCGDRVRVRAADHLGLRVTGPKAADVPTDESNLVLRAARLAGITRAEITLEKHLPAAAGIGGGSADAAATLRALQSGFGVAVPAMQDVLSLGADVPVCLLSQSLRMRGIGEDITPLGSFPALPAVLINPGQPVQTSAVFRRLSDKQGTPMPDIPGFVGVRDCVDWLARQRNDLEIPAIGICPEIGECLTALRGQEVQLARMSGSGATCFGLFETIRSAEFASRMLSEAHPDWWVRAVTLAA
jgi:4-diphosphocytidyl-2-C-methyl-D-erythritol kinase